METIFSVLYRAQEHQVLQLYFTISLELLVENLRLDYHFILSLNCQSM